MKTKTHYNVKESPAFQNKFKKTMFTKNFHSRLPTSEMIENISLYNKQLKCPNKL